MPQKNSYFTATDQFCGAGGSSDGASENGIEIKLALNHWKLAIETHNSNFPNTMHDCTDISACDPRRYPSTNMLITSPECTNHSLAKGKKRKYQAQIEMFGKATILPEEERSRATMWDVPRFAEYHNYDLIITENVVDAVYWVMFDSWLSAMHSLGYKHKIVFANSMFFWPTPQSRDRMYVVFWKKGNPAPDLDYRPLAYCEHCKKEVNAVQYWKRHDVQYGKYKQQYVYGCPGCAKEIKPYYYAAFNAIDWSIPGTTISERKRPLAANTIARIEYGLKKYGQKPMVITGRYTSGIDCRVKDATTEVFPTQPGDASHYLFNPFIINLEHTKNFKNVRDSFDVMQTQTTTDTAGIVVPFLIDNYKNGKSRNVNDPLSCMMPVTKQGIVTHESFNHFISYYYGTKQASHVSEPLGACTTVDRAALVNFNTPKIEDCQYRTLKAHEVKSAMAFRKDYIVLGNSKEQVQQLGNAVTPPVMKWLTKQCKESLS